MAHIPDGFLSAPVSLTTLAVAGGLASYAARRARTRLDEGMAPTLGLATAAMFAAQMINFPVAGGTSGHLLGVTLLAVLLGPSVAFLITVAVLLGQALLFADGGLTALGANALNMGAIGAFLGWGLYRLVVTLTGSSPRGRALAAGVAAYVTTVLTGAAVGIELGASGLAPTRLVAGAMVGVHALIGIVEASVTAFVVWSLARGRTELFPTLARSRPDGSSPRVLASVGGVAILAGALSLVASRAPDSVARAALHLGFAGSATAWAGAPFPGYEAWWSGHLGSVAAAGIGVFLLFGGVAAVVRAVLSSGARPRAETRTL